MKRYMKTAVCAFLILLSVSANVYAIHWFLWSAPVSVRIGPIGPRSADLSVSCKPPRIIVGASTTIEGQLINATSGEGIEGEQIDLHYKQSGGLSWNYITSVRTGFDGVYSYLWIEASTLASGYYAVNATFSGNIDFDRWISITDLQVILPYSILEDFEISVSPSYQEVNPSGAVSYEISLNPLFGFSSDVLLSTEWIGIPPEGVGAQLNPTQIAPSETATLTVTTSSSTPLGVYSIRITGTSGSLSHSIEANLQLGFVIEIEIPKFHVLKDMDEWAGPVLLPIPGWADVYFIFNIDNVDYRIPPEPSPIWFFENPIGHEPSVGDEDCLGPPIIPSGLIKLPFEMTITAMDSDWGIIEDGINPDDTLGVFDLTVTSLPSTQSVSNELISFQTSIRQLSLYPYSDAYPTNDRDNWKQWYWFDVGADLALENYGTEAFDDVVVAVIDTGVDYSHPDLDGSMWNNKDEIPGNSIDDDWNGFVDDANGFDFLWNFISGMPRNWQGSLLQDSNGPMDEGIKTDGLTFYHGTSVAGIIGAEQNNGVGIAGVAPKAKVMALRVGGMMGKISIPPLAPLIDMAIIYAVDNGADVISLSLGGPWEPLEFLAIQYAYKRGVVVVAAAGNERTSAARYPAAMDKVISVSAMARHKVWPWGSVRSIATLDIEDGWDLSTTYPAITALAPWWEGFSNYGPDLEDPKTSVELSAPGQGIWTTDSSTRANMYHETSGTSFSAPIVSAVAATVIGYAKHEYEVELNPAEVKHILRNSAINFGSTGWDPYYGYGMVNVYETLQKVDELLDREHWHIRLDPPGNVDLHVYDSLRKHVGVNYDTGDLEIEIPRAIHTGDEVGGYETIFLPMDVSDYEIEIVGLEANSSSPYTLQLIASDDTGAVPSEWNYSGEIVEGAVYVYRVSIADEIITANPDPEAELEHLEEFVTDLPDDVFVSDDSDEFAEFKKEMFDKIDEALEELYETKYTEAIEKLNDMKEEVSDEDKLQPTTESDLCVIIDHIISSIEALEEE